MRITAEWRKFALFCRRLAAILQTGVPLLQAIEILQLDEADRTSRQQLDRFRDELFRGTSFPQALRHLVPDEYRRSICQLDHVPDLGVFLTRLSEHVTQRADSLDGLVKQLGYPLMLVMTTMGTVLFFIFGLVPRYLEFFSDSNLPIPLVIMWLTSISLGLRHPVIGPLIGVIVLGVCFFGFRYAYRWVKKWGGGGDSRADLFWMIGLMLNSGIPLRKAVTVVAPRDPILKHQWNTFLRALMDSGRFSENAHLYLGLTRYQRELLLCGERSGFLGDALLSFAEDLIEIDKGNMSRSIALVQPIFLVISAVVIVASIYMTMIPVISMVNLM